MKYLLAFLLCLVSCTRNEPSSSYSVSVVLYNVVLYKGELYVTQDYPLEVEVFIDEEVTTSYDINGNMVLRSVFPPYRLRYKVSESGMYTLHIKLDDAYLAEYKFKVSDDLPAYMEPGSYTKKYRVYK